MKHGCTADPKASALVGSDQRVPRGAFVAGEYVEFQAEPHALWEEGVYLRADSDPGVKGWHHIRDARGFRQKHYVPTRRLRKMSGIKTGSETRR
jgi:hypothetical protein